MESPKSFDVILKSDLFKFYCGPEKELLQVHASVFKGLSAPLEKLVSNGMQESIELQATLEDVAPETFVLFAQYAYTGVYRLEPKLTDDEVVGRGTEGRQSCSECGTQYSNIVHSTARGNYYKNGGKCTATFCFFYERAPATTTKIPVGAFTQKTFTVGKLEHGAVRDYLKNLVPIDATSDKVFAHARLYIFAERYMVEELKQLCVHKLHRDLCALKLTNDTVEEIVNMLVYTYDNTPADTEGIDGNKEPGVGAELRKLVAEYAAWKAEKLGEYEVFKAMLARGGEPTATCSP